MCKNNKLLNDLQVFACVFMKDSPQKKLSPVGDSFLTVL